MLFGYNTSFTLPKNPKDLDPSYKMDPDFWDCFGSKKTLSYNHRNRKCPKDADGVANSGDSDQISP